MAHVQELLATHPEPLETHMEWLAPQQAGGSGGQQGLQQQGLQGQQQGSTVPRHATSVLAAAAATGRVTASASVKKSQ